MLLLCFHAQSCLTLCNPVDCTPPDSAVPGISQARILEWVAISSSREKYHLPNMEKANAFWGWEENPDVPSLEQSLQDPGKDPTFVGSDRHNDGRFDGETMAAVVSCFIGGCPAVFTFPACRMWNREVFKNIFLFPHRREEGLFSSSCLNLGQFCEGSLVNFLGGSDDNESACSVGNTGLSPQWGRSPGEGNGYPFQYSCLENSVDRGDWWATVHRVAKSWTWLSDFHFLSIHSWATSLDTSLKMLPVVSYIAMNLWHKEQSRDTVHLHDTVQFSRSVLRGFPVHHQLPEFTQTHVHWVSDAIQPSHPLSSPSLPAFNLSQHQGFSSELVLHIRWPKYWSFSFSICPSNEYSKLISFRIDWFDLFAVQGYI